MIVYLLWRLAIVLVGAVPRRAAYTGAAKIADLVFFCWKEKRENTIDNMRHVLGDGSARNAEATARRSWRNYARCLVDFIRTPAISPSELNQKLLIDGWEEVDAAFENGTGIIFALMHFGSWDLGGAIFSQRYPLNAIAESFAHDRLNQMILQSRASVGMRVIPMEKAGMAVVRALRRNEALAILMDRPGAENGIRVQFFGRETVLPSGPARLALLTKAKIIAAAVVRESDTSDRLRAVIEPAIPVEKTGDEASDLRRLTESILRVHERIIRANPDQWYMFRRMWAPA